MRLACRNISTQSILRQIAFMALCRNIMDQDILRQTAFIVISRKAHHKITFKISKIFLYHTPHRI